MTAPLPSAGRSARAWTLFALVFAAGLTLDLWSKSAVFAWMLRAEPLTARRQIIPGVLRFTLSTNEGIVFGIKLNPALVILATGVALTAVLYFFATSPRKAHAIHVGLGMILAGAIGNLYDRLFSRVQLPGRAPAHRQVRDFIDLEQLHYQWVFNVADALLVVGVGILLASSFLSWRAERKARGKSAVDTDKRRQPD